jgi:glycosyltransferase involved in cell wall biosynthesis
MRYLAQQHAVYLVSFKRFSDTPESISHLKTFCEEVVTIDMRRSRARDGLAMARSIVSGLPFLITRDYSNDMNRFLRELIGREHFDVIHADQLWMAPYALMAKEKAQLSGYSPRLVLDQHNAVFMIPKRMADSSKNPFLRAGLSYESKKMAKYEKSICGQFDRVVWVTKEDWAAVESLWTSTANDSNLQLDDVERRNDINSIIPICFDSSTVLPTDPLSIKNDILFLGGMHWPPNADGVAWFTSEVFPLVRKKLPDVRFVVVGKQPPKALNYLGNNVITTGYVENTDSYWNGTRIFVVPLHAGGGMRVKILEAWARGVPVISTTIGGEGISYSAGEDILIADTPEEFANAVLQISTDTDLAQRLGRGGRKTFENYYEWKRVYPAWDQVYS